MTTSKSQGKLVTWKKDKGFGFIKPNNSSHKIFIHITSLPKEDHPPKIGDVILYEKNIDIRGKVSAITVSYTHLTLPTIYSV